jgi:hypothetical protein
MKNPKVATPKLCKKFTFTLLFVLTNLLRESRQVGLYITQNQSIFPEVHGIACGEIIEFLLSPNTNDRVRNQ